MIRGLALALLVLCSCQCVDPSELEESRREVARLEAELAERDRVHARTVAKMANEQRHLLRLATATTGRFRPRTPPHLEGAITMCVKDEVKIRISANPGNVDIQEQIKERPISFSVYNEDGYKGEAVSIRYEPDANVVLCQIRVRNGEAKIQAGDKASTVP